MDLNNIVNSVKTDVTFPMDRLPSPQDCALARQTVQQLQSSVSAVRSKIAAEKAKMEELQLLHEATMHSLEDQREELEAKITRAQAYLAPVRKLPDELLSDVFLIIWHDGDKKCAWKLAAVCRLWRRVALSLPKIWSAIHLKTTTAACPAEIIRLWLERSGRTVPLDIDITLNRIPGSSAIPEKPASARRRLIPSAHPHALPSLWSAVGAQTTHTHLSPPIAAYASASTSKADDEQSSGSAMAWGFIVFDYLVRQMERWKRFRFLFSATFPSTKALDEIRAKAPLLEEFAVGCTDSAFYPPASDHWRWLPSADPRQWTTKPTPNLRSLELRNVPFQWSSPMLSGLTSLKLICGTLTSQGLTLNRVMAILSASPNLKVLELNIVTQSNILPLAPVSLPDLEVLKLGGTGNTGHLQQLIGQLITPALSSIAVETDSRTEMSGMGETLNNLLVRSSNPLIKSFTYGTTSPSNSAASSYVSHYVSFPTTVLQNLHQLEELTVSGCPTDQILSSLASSQGQQELDHAEEETEFGGPGLAPPGAFIGGFGTTTFQPPGNGPLGMGGLTAALFNLAANTPVGGGGGGGVAAAAAALINAATGANNAGNPNGGAGVGGGIASIFANLPILVTPPAQQNQFNDDYLCQYLRKITFKNCHFHPEGVTKLIKMVEARNPEQLGGGGGADTSIPRRLKSLEFLECGHVGGDVIEWLKGRVDDVTYTEATGASSYRHTTTYHYSAAF